jgi:hypothetical protein
MPVRDGVNCRPIWVSDRSPPSLRTCSIAPSGRLLPTARGDDAPWLGSAPRSVSAEPCESALFGSAHVLSVGFDPCRGPIECHSTGRNACDRLRRRGESPALEGLKRFGRIAVWRTPDELDDLLKLAWPELSDDLIDAPLMKQQNSRYDGFGHTLNGGPSHRLRMKIDPKTIRHGAGIYSASRRDAASAGESLRKSSATSARSVRPQANTVPTPHQHRDLC